MKAYLHVQIISLSANLKKSRQSKTQDLSSNIKNVDQQIASSSSPDLLNRRVSLRTEFDLITPTDAEHLLLRTRSTYYEHGDKAGRLMNCVAKQQSHIIPQIKDSSGVIYTDPIAINSVFSTFYSSLCQSDAPADSAERYSFLDELSFPTIDPDAATDLDSPLTTREIILAINNMQSNKAPGPDGFPVELLKKFKTKLELHSLHSESLDSGSLPPTLHQASIKLLLKKDKDPDLCTSYRPISLINVDAKILAKL